jgi:hypothetical protein
VEDVLDLVETDCEQPVSREGRNVYPRELGTGTEWEDRLTYRERTLRPTSQAAPFLYPPLDRGRLTGPIPADAVGGIG